MVTKNVKLLLTVGFVLLFISAFVYGQDNAESTRATKLSIEIDPATFVFGGYGVHLRLNPFGSRNVLVGVGAYAMNFPQLLVDLNGENRGDGWDVRLNQGYGLFGEYHFAERNVGFFTGIQLGYQEYKLENDSGRGSAKYRNLLAMGYGGYSIPLFNSHFSLKPWGGIGYTPKLSGDTTVNGIEYDLSPITVFATLHLVYTL